MHKNFTDEDLQLQDLDERNRMDFFTDFVDDIDDVQFDEFFGGRKKRQERLEKRLKRRQERKDKRGKNKDARVEARELRRATRAGMTLDEYRASRIDADTDENLQLDETRDKTRLKDRAIMKKRPLFKGVKKAVLKEQANQVNDQIINGETPIDAPLNQSKVSFFEANKQMILIGGAVLIAGIVYLNINK